MSQSLPEPTRERWQPLRAGLVDLFYYDEDEFWFRDGRLLLRGNNGTGKSKVLALTLPFLLDGDLAAHRVEPDADPKKRMEWNLLLGGEHPHPERLGYTWLELGRQRDDGTADYRTLGCGLKAVSGRGITRHWFFLTRQRVGAGLSLVDATGTALSRDRLPEVLGPHGTVYDRATGYRRAVDETFFGLGEHRYAGLVDLLVRLRQPQLSKRPSERALSDALTGALPPLDQAVVADVAEAFRSLEEDRDAVRAMEEARQAAESFLRHYRRYAQVASRRRAALPRRAQAAYESVTRDLADAEAAFAAAGEALAAAETNLAELVRERARLQARAEALRSGTEAKDAERLRAAAEQAGRAAAEAVRAAVERDRTRTRLFNRRTRAAEAAERQRVATNAVGTARQATTEAAAGAGVGLRHLADVDAPLAAGSVALDRLQAAAGQVADQQQRALAHVRSLLDAVEQAVRALAEARRALVGAESQVSEAVERRREAGLKVAERAADHVAAARAHFEAAVELRLGDPGAVLAALELWVETLDGPSPARTGAVVAGQEVGAELAGLGAGLDQRHDRASARRSELAAEIDRLEAGEHTMPPAPYTRAPDSRAAHPGAPFWQLVDFADGVDPAERAGIEAALEAAGILDAWVTPAGELLAGDSVLQPLPVDRRPGAGLDRLLRPAVDRGDPQASVIADETVAAILDSVGLGADGGTWINADGRFQMGVLHGSWRKESAEYVGRGAREAARRDRLARLRAELSAVDSELAAVGSGRQQLAGRRAVLAAELATVPPDDALRAAHAELAALAAELDRLHHRAQSARAAVATVDETVAGARRSLAEGSAELGLPAERGGLDRMDSSLADYRVALAGLWPAVRDAAGAARQDVDARAEVELAAEEHAARLEVAVEAEQRAAADAERHRTLRETVGAAVAELERQLAEVAGRLDGNRDGAKRVDGERTDAVAARGRAEGRRDELATKLADATDQRASAADGMRRFAATGLLAVALPDLELPDPDGPWAPDPTVRLARQVERELDGVPDDDAAWDRVQRRLTDEQKALTDTLAAQDNTVSAQLLDEGVVVEVTFHGRPATVPALVHALDTEVADRRRLLDEREREILENHLVNEVASTLQELISSAEAQVARMNAELAERPTSTGMRLRLLWLPREDGPARLAAARERLLRQTADAWSAEDRAAVGGFLQARIAEVRSRDAAGTWLEHLTEALDYRSWNRFAIQRHQGGQWRSASGPASGGERVLAASVPLFAAASAHYASAASPYAPRLVTLDEAFAGVDDNARAAYFGLLAAFDLDVVMTSEREWGCYPEVPGLAIAHLSRADGVPAVLVTRWEWDGTRRTRRDRPLVRVGSPAAPPAEPPDGLFE